MDKEQAIRTLCEAIEQELGRKIQTPRDFSFLADSIFEKLHETVSATTLKRMWGYLSEPVTPRLSTLNILSQFVGYSSWEDFCEKRVPEHLADLEEDKQQKSPRHFIMRVLRQKHLIMAIALVAIVAGAIIYVTKTKTERQSYYVLKKGQKFKSYTDYLTLFGITDTERYWDKVHPHYEYILIWGPEYLNKYWHNYGDSSQLMPTITERWEPEGVDSVTIQVKNRDNFNHERRVNEIRITFMNNLVDSSFVFLGVYRMAVDQSDTTHCVWERVLEECDLNNLQYLETLRNK